MQPQKKVESASREMDELVRIFLDKLPQVAPRHGSTPMGIYWALLEWCHKEDIELPTFGKLTRFVGKHHSKYLHADNRMTYPFLTKNGDRFLDLPRSINHRELRILYVLKQQYHLAPNAHARTLVMLELKDREAQFKRDIEEAKAQKNPELEPLQEVDEEPRGRRRKTAEPTDEPGDPSNGWPMPQQRGGEIV